MYPLKSVDCECKEIFTAQCGEGVGVVDFYKHLRKESFISRGWPSKAKIRPS